MPNYRKSFNFRHGVQVDEDNFVVNPIGLVGIGTTVPTELLDVLGNVKISGILSVNQLQVNGGIVDNSGTTDFTKINVGITSIVSGIITATSGVVTYYGDGGRLLNLPTSQWLDVDVGLGFTSIYAQGFVGVGTVDPRFLFQVGGNNNSNIGLFRNGVGVGGRGDIIATGVITARSFVGYGSDLTLLNADNIVSGTLSNSRLPSSLNLSGIITAGNYFSGNLIGIARTADSVTTTANIVVNSINSGFSTAGIATITNKLHVQGQVGVGTLNPNVDIHVRKTGISAIQLTSDGTNSSRFTLGRNVSLFTNNGELEYGNTDPGYPDSTQTSFDITNYGVGNINNYLHLGPSGVGTGNFNWIYGQSLGRLMTLTYTGNLGIGTTNPTSKLHVIGSSYIGGDLYIDKNLSVGLGFTPSSINVTNNAIFNGRIGILTDNPIYPIQIGREPFRVDGGLALFRNGDVWSAGIITATRFDGNGSTLTNLNPSNISSGTISGAKDINISGVVTATRFDGNGSTLTNLNPSNISSGTISGAKDINISGVVTATRFVGNGFTLTNLNPSNLSDGTISGAKDINISGVVTATRFEGNGSTLTNLNGSEIKGSIQLNPNEDILVPGITTSQNGFTSGIGTAVQITTSGDILQFFVPGVGSTSFKLYPPEGGF